MLHNVFYACIEISSFEKKSMQVNFDAAFP